MPSEDQNQLGEQIAKAKAERAERDGTEKAKQAESARSMSAGAHALRYSVEFGASIFVGGAMGYAIDHFAGTAPWGLLIMGAFGLAAGVRNMVRAYHQLNADAQRQMQSHENGSETGDNG